MRFPSRLLAANLLISLACWGVFLVLVTLATFGVAIFGHVTRSGWDVAASVPRWYSLFAGALLIREFLPLYIAHGQTRRRFGADAAVTLALLAPALAILVVAGYLLEHLLYGVAGWPHALDRPHLFGSPTDVPMVFAEYLVVFGVWLVAGALIGAAFYRWEGGGGLVSIPIAVGLVVLAEGALGTALRLPLVRDIAVDLPRSAAVTAGVSLAVFVAGLALTWGVIRDVPLRNKS